MLGTAWSAVRAALVAAIFTFLAQLLKGLLEYRTAASARTSMRWMIFKKVLERDAGGIEKIGPDYACGKVDVFSAVIALRYLLRDDEFKAFKAKLVKCVNGYLSSDESIGEERLLEAMGFPAEWKKITRYKL